MAFNAGWYTAELRRELGERARVWSAGRAHVESYGGSPVIVFSPEEQAAGVERHGNFFDEAYAAIQRRPEWRRRFEKIHAQGRALILPCLGRTDRDRQASGEQGITVEDAMSMVHISFGFKDPDSIHMRSECAILAGLAQATLPDTKTPWQDYADNYDRIRDTMSRALPGFVQKVAH